MVDCLLDAGSIPNADAVKELVSPDATLTEVPELAEYAVDLGVYDGLLSGSGVAS